MSVKDNTTDPEKPSIYNRFIALDVETSNQNRSSICQIGIVEFENGEVVRTQDWLVDPMQKFDKHNVRIHGIDNEAVINAPFFPQVFAELRLVLENQVIVSHSSFDLDALSSAIQQYNLPSINFVWLDSIKIAKEAWPDSSSFKLKHLASDLGIEFKHHKACEDALVSGKVLLFAIRDTGIPLCSWVERMGQHVSTIKKQQPATQINLFKNTEKNEIETVTNEQSTGCCSLYRECSLEKKCVSPYKHISDDCIYKTNLEAGRIFYTKNANAFSMETYESIVERYNGLDGETKAFTNNVLHYFLIHRRLYQHALFLRSPQLDRIIEGSFLLDETKNSIKVLALFSERYLRSFITNKDVYQPKCRDAIERHKEKYPDEKKRPSFGRKRFLMNYLLKNDPDAMSIFYDKYAYVCFDLNLFRYFEELYMDEHMEPINFKEFLMSVRNLAPNRMISFE